MKSGKPLPTADETDALQRTPSTRNMGQVFTPPFLAEWTADLLATRLPQHHPVSVLDPACGDGALLAATKHAIHRAVHGLQAVLFPVDEVDVYAETEPGLREKIPRKKALINSDTRHVLAVVSKAYHVVLNRDALRLAEKCCIAAFPNTAPANWHVFSVEAPKSGGHCRIDLTHKGEIPAYDWTFARSAQDRYDPFVRVTNSYNGTRRFALHFGLVRFKCTNGIVIWDASVNLSFTHDQRDIERRIEQEIDEAKFRVAIDRYRSQADRLRAQHIPQSSIRPIVLSALRIREPSNLPEDRQADWTWLERQVDSAAERYVREFGTNGDALLNTLTEVATRPPGGDGRYTFIRRERHDLQRLAGVWLASFTESLRRSDFDLDQYFAQPSDDLLLA